MGSLDLIPRHQGNAFIAIKKDISKGIVLIGRSGKKTKSSEEGEASIAAINSDGYVSSEVLLVSANPSSVEWISDPGYSFHMCPNKDWFQDFKKESGMVLLGDNKSC